MSIINIRLAKAGLTSRLAYIYVSGIHEGIVTEWGFEKEITKEAVAANILVSEEVRKLRM